MRRHRRRRPRAAEATPLAPAVAACLVFFTMLSSTLLIPALRPFFATLHPGEESGLYLFMTVNMLGAIIGAPLLTRLADASGKRALLLIACCVVDGAFLFLCTLPLALPTVLVLRTIQGAANVAAVSMLMGMTTQKGVAVAGGATIAAIAVGAPLGAVLLKFSAVAPLQVGAMLPLAAAAAIGALQPGGPASAPARRRLDDLRRIWPAGLLVLAERLAIGFFIIPFSLLMHEFRGLDDAVVGRLYAAFLVPFALGTAVWARIRIVDLRVVVVGAIAYAAGLVLAARVDGVGPIAVALVLGGLGAAGVYATALLLTLKMAARERPSAAMGLVNAMGALGMLLGSGGAGVLTRSLTAAGVSRDRSLQSSLDVAAVSVLFLAAVTVPLLRRQIGAAEALAAVPLPSEPGDDNDDNDDNDDDERRGNPSAPDDDDR